MHFIPLQAKPPDLDAIRIGEDIRDVAQTVDRSLERTTAGLLDGLTELRTSIRRQVDATTAAADVLSKAMTRLSEVQEAAATSTTALGQKANLIAWLIVLATAGQVLVALLK